MPKYGIHYLVLQNVRERLASSGADASLSDVARILKDNRFAANLGCIGPDLFFWTPDYEMVAGLEDLVSAYNKVMSIYEPIEKTAQTIVDGIEQGVDVVVDALRQVPIIGPAIGATADVVGAFHEVTKKVGQLTEEIKSELGTALFVKVLGLDGTDRGSSLARSLFQGFFQSKQQAGFEEMDWYWIEMLHYRKTGDFVKALIRRAEDSGDKALMAYAYGYLTHYTTDLTGHPFVNTISGSPFRMNVQRHVVIESYMDQWAWTNSTPSIFHNTSAGNPRNVRETLFDELGFEDVKTLPDNIASFISTTVREVYAQVRRPQRLSTNDGFLSAEDLQVGYEFQRLMLKHLGGQRRRLRPVQPFPGADAQLADLIDIPPAPPPVGIPENVDQFLVSIEQVLRAMGEFIVWAVDAVVAFAKKLVEKIQEYVANPTEALIKDLKLLGYAMQIALYEVYRSIHQILALSGLSYPEPDDVALSSPVAARLITTDGATYKHFPMLRTPGQSHLDLHSYTELMDQPANGYEFREFENPKTIASHYRALEARTPLGFMSKIPLEPELLKDYARAPTPTETRQLQETHETAFGNATDLTLHILKNRKDQALADVVFCNWNLDGDRGYGYKTWDAVPFTVAQGEMDGAISGWEVFDEVKAQDRSVWTRVAQTGSESSYTEERYVSNKKELDSLIATLNIAEARIPDRFADFSRLSTVSIEDWSALLPSRLHPGSVRSENVYFCNGLRTTPSSGARVTIALQKMLNDTLRNFRVQLLHNYTSLEFGNLSTLADLVQAVRDYVCAMRNTDAIDLGRVVERVHNPTQLATLALLHRGMADERPLILSAHSQGTMITANAVLVFSALGADQRKYLKEKVSLLHLEPVLLVGTRDLLRKRVHNYLVYMMNTADPAGADPLMDIASGKYPSLSGQSGAILLEKQAVEFLQSAWSEAKRSLVPGTLETQTVGGASDMSRWMGQWRNYIDQKAHQVPTQFTLMAADIEQSRYRTDPATVENGAARQLSTASPIGDASVDVRKFFTGS